MQRHCRWTCRRARRLRRLCDPKRISSGRHAIFVQGPVERVVEPGLLRCVERSSREAVRTATQRAQVAAALALGNKCDVNFTFSRGNTTYSSVSMWALDMRCMEERHKKGDIGMISSFLRQWSSSHKKLLHKGVDTNRSRWPKPEGPAGEETTCQGHGSQFE